MPEAILFDLDGCIVDSLPGIVHCWEVTLPEFGLEAPSPEVIRPHVGPPVDVAARAFAPGFDEPRIAELVAAYRVCSREMVDLEPFAGMPELLRDLHARGMTLGIATSKSIEVAEPLLERLGLTPLFAVIEGTGVEELGTDKATIVGRALARLDPVRPFALVGDREHDVEGAHAHGLRAIGAVWGYGGEAELTAAGADVLVRTPAELGSYLQHVELA